MEETFEKYLNNEMSAEERAPFEQRLAREPELAAGLEEYKALIDALQTQMIREKITAIVASGREGDLSKKTTKVNWYWLLGVLLLILVAMTWYFGPHPNKSVSPSIPQLQQPEEQLIPLEEKKSNTPLENASEDKAVPEKEVPHENKAPKPAKRSIAERQVSEPDKRLTGLRGLDTNSSEWATYIESIWFTRFAPQPGQFNERFLPVVTLLKNKNYTDAFVQLYMLERETPENDTLAYLKGYCLLEMKEGTEALSYFEKIVSKNNWQQELQWYTVLAHLLSGNKGQAVEKAAVITAEQDHPFREKARLIYE